MSPAFARATRSRADGEHDALREQPRTFGRDLHVGATPMQPQPAAFNREPQAGAIFGRPALVLKQKRFVDLLDMDASCTAIMACAISIRRRAAFLRVGVGAISGVFHSDLLCRRRLRSCEIRRASAISVSVKRRCTRSHAALKGLGAFEVGAAAAEIWKLRYVRKEDAPRPNIPTANTMRFVDAADRKVARQVTCCLNARWAFRLPRDARQHPNAHARLPTCRARLLFSSDEVVPSK